MKLLTVQSNRLRRWHRPGFLAIGDAAHAMSPLGGVGINLAIHDAVETANIMGPRLVVGELTEADLRRVQRRRELPTVVIQRFQQILQQRVIAPTLADRHGARELGLPLPVRLLKHFPPITGLTARLIGLGVRRVRLSDTIVGERLPSGEPKLSVEEESVDGWRPVRDS